MDQSPWQVRRSLVDDRDALMITAAVLYRPGCGAAVPDAVEYALAGARSGSAANLPFAVAWAITNRLPDAHRPAVWQAVDTVLKRFEETDQTAELAELCVHRIADTVRAALTASVFVAGSDAQLPDMTGPAPEPADDLADAADFAAGFVYADVIERVRTDLEALAGLE